MPDQHDFLYRVSATRARGRKPRAEVGGAGVGHALLDQVVHVLDCAVEPAPI